ncbi:family 78 glycoside hydrolase catalytic domain [Proteiniphilum sp.]|uniref:family 78 glycoside hydrolase catalytic domain n=1 Tax=Proteiniphilum sp. TaxID=1926877 RepID=UPI002B1FD4EE|nr:family 78 glycoside hydrolase catalytic domain [Proteiniphilum sp.]MEA4917822.1 family 78 glycoside hydrolase catalytic domain [Proteiniphilum sp.]
MKPQIILLLSSILLLTACSGKELSSLKVEYEETPLGIDVERPRFSWQMVSDKQRQSQSAYQITVTDKAGQEVWNSGKIESDISLNIEYAGKTLQPSTRYHWTVQVWDQDNKPLSAHSWFETGLMNPSIEAWDGARWIGGGDEDLVLYPDYLPTYNINYTLQLDKESNTTKAGFIFGANDPRLMNKNKNIYNLQNEKDQSYIEVELDISKVDAGANAFLYIYRVGYAPGDNKNTPFRMLAIPASLINKRNKYDKHTVYLKTMYSNTEFYIDGEGESNKIGSITINPIGNSWDYICFPLLCEIGFTAKPGQSADFSNLEVRNYRIPNNILFSEKLDKNGEKSVFADKKNLTIDNDNYRVNGSESGTLITANIQKKSMPLLRTTFKAKKATITDARLYITTRGIYEVYMNGKKVGDDYFNPGLTQYNKHHLYQTYDITDYVKADDNALGIAMGEGWWSGAITYMGYLWNLFGDRQSLLAKLVVSYGDGTKETIVSNSDTWSYFDNGPIIYSSFFQGEVYDARKESLIEGWTEASYNASDWKKAVEVNQEKAIIEDKAIEMGRMPAVNDFSHMKLIGQYGQTVKKIKELTAISMEEVRPGVYLYDMGQNMAGIPRITLQGEEPGSEIKLRFAEVKYPDLPEFKENVGMIMLENIRGAMAQDIYITKGGNETILPRFTFHGYRFIEITGIDKPLPLEAVKGDVLSSIHELTSGYETSNAKVNKLWENITWSTFANFISIPTDCPQRNERMGWSGDISVFSRTATYLGNISQFLHRHMLAMRDTQRKDGRFADVAPIGGGFGGILWGSAGITVPWESYLQYNDERLLADHYEAMKTYIRYLVEYIDPETGILTEGNLGDWLGPEQEKNDNTLLWEAYFIYDLELMQRMATVLDRKEDAEWFSKLHSERKAFFNNTYFNHETGETIHSGFRQPERKGELIGTQTSYLIPLAFDICNEEIKERVLKQLIHCIENPYQKNAETVYPPYSLMTGFIGTAWINRILSELGYSEAAYRILQQTDYPSWLYSVDQGATTIWERLNSYTREHGFSGNNSMNSFNHYSFGAIGSWMYNHSLGIERDENHPGFKHFVLQPEPDPTGEMTFAKGHYDSMYGRIESSWERKGDICQYRFTVPANSSATLYLQAAGVDMIKEGNKPLTKSKEIKIEGEKDGRVIMELQPGKYRFSVKTK